MKVRGKRVAADNCQSFRVATKTVLEQERKFGIAVGHVLFPFLKGRNHIRKNTQAGIDVLRLFKKGALKPKE